jgi:hypothetical protein
VPLEEIPAHSCKRTIFHRRATGELDDCDPVAGTCFHFDFANCEPDIDNAENTGYSQIRQRCLENCNWKRQHRGFRENVYGQNNQGKPANEPMRVLPNVMISLSYRSEGSNNHKEETEGEKGDSDKEDPLLRGTVKHSFCIHVRHVD